MPEPIAPGGEKIVFDITRFATRRRVSRAVEQNTVVSAWRDQMLDQMVVELDTAVLTRTVVGDDYVVAFDEPASWLQMWKRDRLPRDPLGRWVLRRRPVRTRRREVVVAFTRKHTYPEAPVPVPADWGRPVVVETASHHWLDGEPYGGDG